MARRASKSPAADPEESRAGAKPGEGAGEAPETPAAPGGTQAGPAARGDARSGPATSGPPGATPGGPTIGDAVEILPPDAPRDEWLQARQAGITASEIAVVLGISPFDSAFNLYWRKRGDLPPEPDSDRMSLGRHLEPWIADRWAEPRGWFLQKTGLLAHHADPTLMATPDYTLHQIEHLPDRPYDRIMDAAALLEIKSSGTYEGWGPDGSDEVPAYYRAQVLWQLHVTGLKWAYVAVFFLSSQQFRTYEIGYDADDVAVMEAAARDFLRRLEGGEPPELDAHTATTQALKELWPDVDDGTEATVPGDLAQRYRQACADYKEAEAAKKRAENELRDQLGDRRVAVDRNGRKLASRSVYETSGLDRDRLRRDHPEAAAACRTTTTIDRLNPARSTK